MDREDDAEGAVATADGGLIVDNDGATANSIHVGTLCVFQPIYPVSKQLIAIS
jgi:hypothetical protein